MKKSVRKIPAALSLVLLAAHFLRMQHLLLVVLNLGLIPLLFLEKRSLARGIRLYLLLGSALWVQTLLMIAMERKAMGVPFVGAAIILGAVAVFTLTSALVAPLPENTADVSRR